MISSKNLHKVPWEDALDYVRCLEAENFRLRREVEDERLASNRYVTLMVQQAQASDSMKLQLIISGLLRSPSELSDAASTGRLVHAQAGAADSRGG